MLATTYFTSFSFIVRSYMSFTHSIVFVYVLILSFNHIIHTICRYTVCITHDAYIFIKNLYWHSFRMRCCGTKFKRKHTQKHIKIKINTRITMQLLVYKHLSNLCLLCVELTSNAFDHMNENRLLYLLLHLSYVFHLLVE